MGINIKKIIELRKQNKLTITETAKILDKARSTVSSWENGNTLPSKTDTIALAQLLGVKTSEISDYKDIQNILNLSESSNIQLPIIKDLAKADNKILNKYNNIPKEIIEIIELLGSLSSENKRLEAINRSFKKSNIRYKTIINSIHEIIYIKDFDRKFKKVNDKFIDEFLPGYTSEDIIGTKFIDIIGRKEIAEIILWENHVFQSGQNIIDEKIKIPGSAGKKTGLISIEPIFDENDKVIEIAVSIKDISDIIKNIEDLELLESVSYKLDDQVWILTENPIQYRFIGGKGFKETYGISKEDFVTNPKLWLDMVHPNDLSKADIKRNEGFFPLPLGENDIRIIHKDGTVKWIKYKAFRTYDVNNKPILYGITTDITNNVKHQISLDYLNKAINTGNDVVWVGFNNKQNSHFEYLYLNGNIEKLLGVNKEQLKKNSQAWIKNIYPLDIKKVKKNLSSNEHPISFDFRIQIDSRTLKWIHFKKCYRDDYYYGAFYDITLRKASELKREIMERGMSKAQDALWVFDSNFKCILITRATEKIYGISFKNIDDPIRYWTDKILHPDCKKEYEERLNHFKTQKKLNHFFKPKPLVFKAIRADGSQRYIESLFTCMKYNGEILDIALDRDITDLYIEVLKIRKVQSYLKNDINIPQAIKDEIKHLLK